MLGVIRNLSVGSARSRCSVGDLGSHTPGPVTNRTKGRILSSHFARSGRPDLTIWLAGLATIVWAVVADQGTKLWAGAAGPGGVEVANNPRYALGVLGGSAPMLILGTVSEKAIVTKDSLNFTAANPPLSEAGQVRAFVLRDELGKKNIENIFSTNYHRTVSTAMPLSDARNNMTIQYYNSSKDSLDSFIEKLKAIRKGNVLVVGHSNTVDDIVNKLTGEKNVAGDLRDSEYDNMYIIRYK